MKNDEKLNKINEFRKNSLIDMHTHTCYSDGQLTPNELIKRAYENNVGILAITDHDTVLGLKNIIHGYSRHIHETEYVEIIPGIELTANFYKGRMHILGYGIDIKNEELNEKLNEIKSNNINYMILLLAQINKDYKIKFLHEDIKELFNTYSNIGRVDIAKLCMQYGYASSVQEAFDKYLIEAYDKIRINSNKLSYQECIELILNSGGVPVLAHPKTLELTEKELLILIKEMIDVGLKGIEVYHSSHSESEINQYLAIASKYDLLISGGSDFHGEIVKPGIEIGTGKNNLKIKSLSLLDYIKNDLR